MLATRNYRRLGKRQLAVITDLFDTGLSEDETLKKNSVPKWLYRKWLANETFTAEFNARVSQAVRQSRRLIARSLPLAASRLAQLTVSDKDETARKACLDLISLPLSNPADHNPQTPQSQEQDNLPPISPDQASKILQILAQPAETPNPLPNNDL